MPKALHGTTYVFSYIFAIARFVYEERLTSISFDEMHRRIKKFAIDVQVAKEIEAGKKWRDYRKKAQEATFMREAADKTITAMVRWGFLERPTPGETGKKREREYYVKPRLHAIGQELVQERLQKARLLIFDRILQSERDTAFAPQLLVKIRDAHTISELGREYALPADGVIQSTPAFVRNSLKIGQIDFNMTISWFQALKFLNVFDPKVLDTKLPQEIYLTAWLATEEELSSFYRKITSGNTETKSFTELNCMKLLEIIEAIRVENGQFIPLMGESLKIRENKNVQQSLNDPYVSNLTLIGDTPRFQGLATTDMKDVRNVYYLFPRQISTGTFAGILRKYYETLRIKWKSPYVWISPLRALCCRSLMIDDDYFDGMLTQLYKQRPEAFEFSKAATGIFRKRVRVFEKPFKLYGNPFRMVRLVEHL